MLIDLPLGETVGYLKHDPRGIEIQARSLKGLPDPLLIAVVASPHGSTTNWQLAVLGLLEGKLKVLRKDPFELWSSDGIFIGDLGSGRGVGVATWEFLWDDCHLCPSRYGVHFFPWQATLKLLPSRPSTDLRTTGKFDDGISAIRSLGLPYSNTLYEFKRLEGFW